MHNRAGLEEFARKSFEQGKWPWAILQVQRDGKPWYILIVGRFETIGEARKVLSGFSTTQKQYGPWPKALKIIHETPFSVVASSSAVE